LQRQDSTRCVAEGLGGSVPPGSSRARNT